MRYIESAQEVLRRYTVYGTQHVSSPFVWYIDRELAFKKSLLDIWNVLQENY
jgi:hypothetical protein